MSNVLYKAFGWDDWCMFVLTSMLVHSERPLLPAVEDIIRRPHGQPRGQTCGQRTKGRVVRWRSIGNADQPGIDSGADGPLREGTEALETFVEL